MPISRVVHIAREHGLAVIEDACQMPGALIEERRAGTWGDIGVISFGGSKLLSAGRGGALLTSSPEINQRIQVYCNRGNHAYPLSELQATVLLPQLEKLDQRNRMRANNVSQLSDSLKIIAGLRLLRNQASATFPGYYKLGFQYDPAGFAGLSRESFVQAAKAEGIEFNIGFRAFHPCRSSRRWRKPGDLTEAAHADANMLVLHHPILLGAGEVIDQLTNGIYKISSSAEVIKKALS